MKERSKRETSEGELRGLRTSGARDAHSIGLLYVYVFLSLVGSIPFRGRASPRGVRACQRVLSPPPSTLHGRNAHKLGARASMSVGIYNTQCKKERERKRVRRPSVPRPWKANCRV